MNFLHAILAPPRETPMRFFGSVTYARNGIDATVTASPGSEELIRLAEEWIAIKAPGDVHLVKWDDVRSISGWSPVEASQP